MQEKMAPTAPMKLAISGKGGVGKTTLTALLAVSLVDRGYRVTAIDADPNPTLAAALGLPSQPITPLLELQEEIEQRVGGTGGFVRLNPRVDDLVDRVAVVQGGIRLVVAGAITRGGAGCACPQSVLLRRVIEFLALERDQALLVDLEAGLEHLGRRSAHAADALLVVVDPSRASLETAARIRRLAADIGVGQVLGVANRVRGSADEAFLAAHHDGLDLIGAIPYSEALKEAERTGEQPAAVDNTTAEAVARLVDALETRFQGRVRE